MTDPRDAILMWMDGELDNDGLVQAIYNDKISNARTAVQAYVELIDYIAPRRDEKSDFDRGFNAGVELIKNFGKLTIEEMSHVDDSLS